MAVPIATVVILAALIFQSPSATLPLLPQTPATAAAACNATVPNGHAVTWATVPPHSFNHGNASISTTLWPDGTVLFRPNGPGHVLADGSLAMKFLWFKPQGVMTIEGRRLDGPAAALRVNLNHEFDSQDYQPSSLIFVTEGCWEVASRVGGASLTFVTRVVKVDGPPTKG